MLQDYNTMGIRGHRGLPWAAEWFMPSENKKKKTKRVGIASEKIGRKDTLYPIQQVEKTHNVLLKFHINTYSMVIAHSYNAGHN